MFHHTLSRTRLYFGLLVTVGIVSAFIRILPWRLDYNDLAKQAYASYDMIEHGAWLVQESPDKMMATKPPFVAWLSAAIFLVCRNWLVAWHLPSFIAAVVVLLLFWKWENKQETAIFAGLIFLLNHFTQNMIFVIRTDMVLAMWVHIAVGMIYTHLQEKRPWTIKDNSLFFAVLLCGMYTKGPVILLFLLPGAFSFLLSMRKTSLGKKAFPALWVWALSVLGFLLWVVLAAVLDERFYDQVVIQEFMTRFQSGGVTRARPPGRYFLYFLARFLPWSLMFVFYLFKSPVRELIKRTPEIRWLFFTCIASWVLLEFIPSKRPDRLYPLIPIFAWLLAVLHQETIKSSTHRLLRPVWISGLILFSLGSQLAYSLSTSISDYRKGEGELVHFGEQASEIAADYEGELWIQKYVTFSTGMSLYADTSYVVDESEMLEQWLTGDIQKLIVNEEGLNSFTESGVNPNPVLISNNQDASESIHYLLLQSH